MDGERSKRHWREIYGRLDRPGTSRVVRRICKLYAPSRKRAPVRGCWAALDCLVDVDTEEEGDVCLFEEAVWGRRGCEIRVGGLLGVGEVWKLG